MVTATATAAPLFSLPFERVHAGHGFRTPRSPLRADELAALDVLSGGGPDHCDSLLCRQRPFGAPLGYGLHVLCRELTRLPLRDACVDSLLAVRDAVLEQTPEPGEAIGVEGEVVTAEPVDERIGIVAIACRESGDGDRTLARATVELAWRRAARGGAWTGVLPL
jgi:hypothetical protein